MPQSINIQLYLPIHSWWKWHVHHGVAYLESEDDECWADWHFFVKLGPLSIDLLWAAEY